MDKVEKERIEKKRRETSVKTMYFNRFLLIRYITAAFFFANLYWLFSLIMSKTVWAVIPGAMLIATTRAALEQATMYGSKTDEAEKTVLSFKLSLAVNAALSAVLFTPLFSKLFPFLKNNASSHGFILAIIFIGMILCGISLKRLQKINNRTDKQFRYVKQYEKAIR